MQVKTRISKYPRNIVNNCHKYAHIFNTANHATIQMQINAIESPCNSTGYRKAKELVWINKLYIFQFCLNKK